MADDKKGREEKARRLREQIQSLTKPAKSASEPAETQPKPGSKSLREAIHERMEELDQSRPRNPTKE